MSEYRKERIGRLLAELKYEVTRGVMEHEIDEHLTFEFTVPMSRQYPRGVVQCQFRTRPSQYPIFPADPEPKLRIVE